MTTSKTHTLSPTTPSVSSQSPLSSTERQQQSLSSPGDLCLCFTGNRNSYNPKTKKGKVADFTGAFLPEIRSFMSYWNIDSAVNYLKVDLGPVERPSSEASRRAAIFDFIERRAQEEGKAPTSLVFACHGFSNRIELGIRGKSGAEALARLLRGLHSKYESSPLTSKLTIILYCCSTGGGPGIGGDGGLADLLRDALCQEGFVDCRVVGHETAGHATQNPRKRFFDGLGSPVGGSGGMWVVKPGTSLFRTWAKALRATDKVNSVAKSFRWTFPFMATIGDIHRWLLAANIR